jgi:hypothetical protein
MFNLKKSETKKPVTQSCYHFLSDTVPLKFPLLAYKVWCGDLYASGGVDLVVPVAYSDI